MGYCLIQCLSYLIQFLIKSQKFCEVVQVYGSVEEMGIRILELIVLLLFLFCFASLAFFFSFAWGHKSVYEGALLDLLRLYLVFTCPLGCLYV